MVRLRNTVIARDLILMSADTFAGDHIGPGALHSAGLVRAVKVNHQVHVGCVLRRVEVPIGDFAAGGGRKVDLNPHYARLDGFPEVLSACVRVLHRPTMDPYPDLYVLCLRVGSVGRDRLPGVRPLFPALIDGGGGGGGRAAWSSRSTAVARTLSDRRWRAIAMRIGQA